MIKRQIYYSLRRAYCSASNLSSDTQNAKAFSEIPTISFLSVAKNSLPGGKFYKKTMKESLQLFYEEYGNIIRMPSMLKRPTFVLTFNADDFEKVNPLS